MFSSTKKDNRYFISRTQYNCPFCLTGAVRFKVIDYFDFSWSNKEQRRCILIQCQEPKCLNISLHMTKHKIQESNGELYIPKVYIKNPETGKEEGFSWEDLYSIDEAFFYHHPSSSFTVDSRIPDKIRILLDEASVCHKMSLPTGASACLRKAIFELLAYFEIPKTKSVEKDGKEITKRVDYSDRLDILKEKIKEKFPGVDSSLFSDIKKIYNLTSQPLHEKLLEEIEWEDFTPDQFNFLVGVVHDLLLQIFVEPANRQERKDIVNLLAKKIK